MSAPPLKYYYDFLSQPSRALYVLLQMGGRTFEPCAIQLLEGENLGDDYQQQVNRFRKVPAIIHGELKLAESVAILRYLTAQHYIPSNYYPDDVHQRARIDEFLSWQHNGIRSSCSLYFRFLWVEARIMGVPAAAGKVAKYKREMERDLRTLEQIWLCDSSAFLTGDQLTAADVFGACEVEQIKVTGYDVRVKFPKVAAWIDAVRQQLAPHFDEAHRKVYEFEQETKAAS